MEEISEKKLDEILKSTIAVMEDSKTQIFDIYENSRAEAKHIKEDMERIRERVEIVIQKVDTMEIEEAAARNELARVSKNFNQYDEAKIKATYEHARCLQVELAVLREQEQNLWTQRNVLEMRLKKLHGTVGKAKQLVAQIGVVLGYLSAHMDNVVTQVEAATEDKLFGSQVIKAQEEERLRVSREIHDGPAQIIANMIYQSSVCERLIDLDIDRAKEGLQEIREQSRKCLTEIRKIIFDLRPMTLDDLGLVAAIEQYLQLFFHRTGIAVDLRLSGNEAPLDKHLEISMFRIVQEGLNNIHKHAGVKKAMLGLKFNSEYISVVVEDNGKGFDMEDLKTEALKAECYGMMGMKERVKLLKGQFLVSSQPGRGTKVSVLIPLREEGK